MEQKWNFEVGDVVKLKKPHPWRSHEWEILRVGSGFPAEMHGLRPSGHDRAENGRENARGLTKAAGEAAGLNAGKKLNEAWKRAENGGKSAKT